MEIVLLTSNSIRHEFVRKAFGLAEDVRVLRTYCEDFGGTFHRLNKARKEGNQTKIDHFARRARSEYDFFGSFVELTEDHSSPKIIPGGDINHEKYYREIRDLDPDLMVAYGCSLIKDPLLEAYKGRFLNVHLGLSPYYRGTGTNFWPLVHKEPEYVGATFMHIDEGVDTGEIIHQLRARVHPGDGPHQIGNRLISDVAMIYPELARNFDDLYSVDPPPEPEAENYFRKADYSDEATRKMYKNFEEGMIRTYLEQQEERIQNVPIVKHPIIDEEQLLNTPSL